MEIIGEFTTSVHRALGEIDSNYLKYRGLVVAGTHSPERINVAKVIELIKEVRENGTPFLGICFGHQLAAIEYARNVLGIHDATSEELGEGTFVVKKRGSLNVGLKDGESYWNNYEVDSSILKLWQIPEHFFVTQSHPEYQSMKGKPHPLLVRFIENCKVQ